MLICSKTRVKLDHLATTFAAVSLQCAEALTWVTIIRFGGGTKVVSLVKIESLTMDLQND